MEKIKFMAYKIEEIMGYPNSEKSASSLSLLSYAFLNDGLSFAEVIEAIALAEITPTQKEIANSVAKRKEILETQTVNLTERLVEKVYASLYSFDLVLRTDFAPNERFAMYELALEAAKKKALEILKKTDPETKTTLNEGS